MGGKESGEEVACCVSVKDEIGEKELQAAERLQSGGRKNGKGWLQPLGAVSVCVRGGGIPVCKHQLLPKGAPFPSHMLSKPDSLNSVGY